MRLNDVALTNLSLANAEGRFCFGLKNVEGRK